MVQTDLEAVNIIKQLRRQVGGQKKGSWELVDGDLTTPIIYLVPPLNTKERPIKHKKKGRSEQSPRQNCPSILTGCGIGVIFIAGRASRSLEVCKLHFDDYFTTSVSCQK